MTSVDHADGPAGKDTREEVTEGWYLMSTSTLEQLLSRLRARSSDVLPPGALHLTLEEALAYRDAGNLPDQEGRTLRLLLHARDREEVRRLSEKRLHFEPDYHEAPRWRREGSKPVTVVPLRGDVAPAKDAAWWEEPDLASMEAEWTASGAVDGLRIPEEYRGFVYKTILSLRAAGRDVTVQTVVDSVSRWLLPAETAEIRSALERANRSTTADREPEPPPG